MARTARVHKKGCALMSPEESLRLEKLALLIGTMLGQISKLLNKISNQQTNNAYIYAALLDINKMASMQVQELYYKGNKP
jgi:hypothetical protein